MAVSFFSTHLREAETLIPKLVLDEEYFADYLATGYNATARTPFRAVKRLLPGSTLEISCSGLRCHRTWDLANTTPLRHKNPLDYQEKFRELLADGVKASMGQSGATWIALSGGLDSSTVAATAARIPEARVGAYSLIVPACPEVNEERWMRSVIEYTGLKWFPIDVETALPFSELPDRQLDEPSAAVIDCAMSRRIRELFSEHGVSTLLTGDGGDAIFAAHAGPIPTHLADPLFEGRPFRAFSDLNLWMRGSGDERPWRYWVSRALLAPAYAHVRNRAVKSDARQPFPPWLDINFIRQMDLEGRRGDASPPNAKRRVSRRCGMRCGQERSGSRFLGGRFYDEIPAVVQAPS